MSEAAQDDDLFYNPSFDEGRFLSEIENKRPQLTCGIFFTPRSGSSWLTDLLTQTKLLGNPQEWFNPDFISDISRAINSRDIDGYVEILRRTRKAGDCFSFEITIHQLYRTFGSADRYLEFFPNGTTLFYLTRDDIVLQAVSLAKAVNTSVFHSAGATEQDIQRADSSYFYHADEIARWLDHIADQEAKSAAFFKENGIKPHRLTYEQITNDGPEATARRFLDVVRPENGEDIVLPKFDIAHRKIGSSRNSDYAARFREERPDHVGRVEAVRAEAHDD